MADFYFDESKHPTRGGFIAGAFVATPDDITPAVAAALRAEGLTPGADEFKSSANMRAHPEQARLRQQLQGVLHDRATIALVILPHDALPALGAEALEGLGKLLARHESLQGRDHRVYFDEQVFPSHAAAEREVRSARLPASVELLVEQDSRKVLGLQLADLTAHACATLLLSQLGHVRKSVKAGPNSGYDPDLDIDLAFELWARLRWKFFCGPMPRADEMESQLDFKVPVLDYGVFVSARCPPALRQAAEACFGEMYLGCIH